jgi:putative transposase
VIDYRRNLPHWFPHGASIFITWRLAGSLPAVAKSRLPQRKKKDAGEAFRTLDRMFDLQESGPLWLKQPEIAELIERSFYVGQSREQFELHAYVVMANHVHLLLTPKRSVASITQILKGVTAREGNRILGRVGMPFWQDESFDHWIRNESEFAQTKEYIEQNPVKARLVERPEDWIRSSANARFRKIEIGP